MRCADYHPNVRVTVVEMALGLKTHPRPRTGKTISPKPYIKNRFQYYVDVDFGEGKLESVYLKRLQPLGGTDEQS
jgi:hypothetical protein